jgi:hypothetical protein
MICTSEIDMAESVEPADIDHSLTMLHGLFATYHMVLKASPGAAIFARDMLFYISFLADWKQIVQ